jgi:hypothetical protein
VVLGGGSCVEERESVSAPEGGGRRQGRTRAGDKQSQNKLESTVNTRLGRRSKVGVRSGKLLDKGDEAARVEDAGQGSWLNPVGTLSNKREGSMH